jgi:hypothetical protein
MGYLYLYRGSIRTTWSRAPLMGTPTDMSRKGTALFWVTLRNNPEERRSQLLRGGSLKTHISRKALRMELISLQILREGNPDGELLYCGLRQTCKRRLRKRSISFLQGLHNRNLKTLSKGGLGQYVYWAGTSA